MRSCRRGDVPLRDSASPEAFVAVVQHGSLPGCGSPDRLGGLDQQTIRTDQGDGAGHVRRSMADSDPGFEALRWRLPRDEVPARDAELGPGDLISSPDHHGVRGWPDLAHVYRLAQGHAKAVSLADRVMRVAGVGPHRRAMRVHYGPRLTRIAASFLE